MLEIQFKNQILPLTPTLRFKGVAQWWSCWLPLSRCLIRVQLKAGSYLMDCICFMLISECRKSSLMITRGQKLRLETTTPGGRFKYNILQFCSIFADASFAQIYETNLQTHLKQFLLWKTNVFLFQVKKRRCPFWVYSVLG